MDSTDREQLKLLSIFHWVVAGLTALCSLFPLFHFTIGVALVSGRIQHHENEGPARAIGWIFILFASVVIFLGLCFASCLALAGKFLAQRRNRMFCLVIAGISCAFVPFGTALGVFTIIVLSRDSVRATFADAETLPNLPGIRPAG